MRHAIVSWSAGALAAAALASAPVAAGSITVDSATGRTNYLASLDSMVSNLRGLSQTYLNRGVTGFTGIELTYDPSLDQSLMYGTKGFTQADADWARANLRIYDIYRQLGGNDINLKQQYRRSGNQFYVGLDGSGGQWFATLADAQGYMFKLLVGQSAEIPKAVKAALLAANSNDLATVVARARDAMLDGRGVAATGSSTAVTFTGTGFSNANGTPVVIAPAGITATSVTFESSTKVTATLAIGQTAAVGLAKVHLFNAGNTFVPVDTFDLLVVSGSGTLAPNADDHGDTAITATTLAIGTTVAGTIGTATDNDVFQVTLTSAGTLNVASSGPTDVDVRLEDVNGTVIAADADSGPWYNFNLSRALSAGTYFVRVLHCCRGLGNYSVTATFTP
jgi:hypothetical protein